MEGTTEEPPRFIEARDLPPELTQPADQTPYADEDDDAEDEA